MGLFREFRDFAVRGNVIDMAVGIIIGGAFGKIVSSAVADVVMPPIGLLVGRVNFTDLKVQMREPVLDAAGKVTQAAVTLNIGTFLQTCVDFAIMAFAIFLMVKAMNTLKRKEAAAPTVEMPPTRQELLLAEIRDALKAR